MWSEGALVCAGAAGLPACSGGVCAPVPASPLGAEHCVYKDGEEPGCPLDYPNKTILYRGVNDTRSCSACNCGAPSGITCPTVISTFSNFDCSGAAYALAAGGCDNGDYFAGAKFMNAPVGGTCQSVGGQPSGSVSPALPLTICCAKP